MALDITALYCCLDDFCKVFEDWEAHRLIPSQTTRQRTGKLSRSEKTSISAEQIAHSIVASLITSSIGWAR